MNAIVDILHVKRKSFEIPTLDTDSSTNPILHFPNTSVQIQNDAITRWYLRAYFPTMKTTAAGRAWWAAQPDPTALETHVLNALKYRLKPYQLFACARMLLENSALWLDMGLGKTLVSLAYFLLLHTRTGAKTFLVVCPTTVFGSWTEEIDTHYGSQIDRRIVIAHGPAKRRELQRIRTLQHNGMTIIITSYETLESIAPTLANLDLQAILFDEASKVKNHAAKRSQAAKKLVRATPKAAVHLLSGTPSTKNVEGFYPLYELLGRGRSGSPDATTFKATYVQSITIARCRTSDGDIVFVRADDATAYERWMRNNCPPGQTQSYWSLGYVFTGRLYTDATKHIRVLNTFPKPVGVKNLDALTRITLRNAYSLKKEEVAKDLPEKTMVVRHVKMSKEIADAYKKFREENSVALRSKRFSFTSTSPHIKLHQIANGFFYDTDGVPHYFDTQPKIDELFAILEEAGDQKVVIWSPFRPQIARISEALRAECMPHEVIHGDISVQARASIVTKFRKEPEIKYLIANPDVAGMGLTLIESHLAVVMTNWFKADVRAQLIDRLHRIGQLCPVTVVDLVTPDTLEAHILRSLRGNIDIEGAILTGAQLKGKDHDDGGTGEDSGASEDAEATPRRDSEKHRQPDQPAEQGTV